MGSLRLKDLAFGALGLGPKNMVGFDIGSSSIKICELSALKETYKLTQFAIRPLPEGSFLGEEIQERDEVVEIAKAIVKEVKLRSSFTCIGIWGQSVISKQIQVPMGTMEEIQDQVIWESEQYIPFDIEESAISHHFIGENEGGGADVLLAAAKEESIEKFRSIAEEAGLTVKVVDINGLAVANVFSYVKKEELEGITDPILLIDFGANSTSIIIYRHPAVVFTREISVGGQGVSNEIQKAMGLSYEEAEDLKVNGDQNGNLPEEIVEIINSSLHTFLSEIKKTLNFYMTSTNESRFHCCYIMGGTSLLPGLVENLTSELKIEVLFFNPFEKIEADKKFDGDFLSLVGSMGIPSIGLAMRTLSDD